MSPNRSRIALVVALLVASCVVVLEALSEGFWGDELWTVRYAVVTLRETARATAHDPHPPLYYLAVNGWVDVAGVSPLAVRLPSVLFGLGAIGLTYRLGARAYDRQTGAIAAVLCAFSIPLAVYAAEARMYALLLLFTTASYLSFWEFLSGRAGRWTAALYVLSTVGMLYTHVYGAIFFGAQGLVAVAVTAAGTGPAQSAVGTASTTTGAGPSATDGGSATPGFWPRWLPLTAAVGALALPAAYRIVRLKARPEPADRVWVDWIAEADASYLHLFEWLGRPYPVALLGVLCALAVVRVGHPEGWRGGSRGTGRGTERSGERGAEGIASRLPVAVSLPERRQAVFFGGWYAFSLALAWIGSALVQPLFYYRFCVPLLPPVLLLAARGAVRVRRRSPAVAAVVLAVLVVTGAAGAATLVTTEGNARLDDAMAHVDERADGDDAVYVEFWGPEVAELYGTPSSPRVTDVAAAVEEYDRVWVVVSEDRSVPGIDDARTRGWQKFTTSGPYRTYYEGDERVWWVGTVTADDASG